MIYYGFWFAPEREALQGFIDDVAAGRDRHGAAQALQGQRHGGRPHARRARSTGTDFATFEADSRLPPAGRRGLHQPERAPAQDPRRSATRIDPPAPRDRRRADARGVARDRARRRDRARGRRAARLHHDRRRARRGARAVVPVATPTRPAALRRDGQTRARPRRGRARRRAPAGLRPRQLAGRVHARPGGRPHGRVHDDQRHPGAARPRGRAPDRGRRLRERRGGAAGPRRSRATSCWCARATGAFSLEDAVCAGLLVSRLASADRRETDAARAARVSGSATRATSAPCSGRRGGGPGPAAGRGADLPPASPWTSTRWSRCSATAPWSRATVT